MTDVSGSGSARRGGAPPAARRLEEAVQEAKAAFYKAEADSILHPLEFLYQQSRFLHRRWWLMQAALLLILWRLLHTLEFSAAPQKLMGTAAPLFALLLLPELWKNRRSGAMEVEGAAYFSLRQVYAARLLLFALADLVLLSAFAAAAILVSGFRLPEILIQFFLPYMVASGICFRCLYSQRNGSDALAVFLCMVWCGIWTQIILREDVYAAISLPVWYAALAAAVLNLGYCIYRGQQSCQAIWEAKPLWN